MEIIESKENKLIKSLKKLKQKKYRDSENKFLAEGYKFLDYNYSPEMIIVREDIFQLPSISMKNEMQKAADNYIHF